MNTYFTYFRFLPKQRELYGAESLGAEISRSQGMVNVFPLFMDSSLCLFNLFWRLFSIAEIIFLNLFERTFIPAP